VGAVLMTVLTIAVLAASVLDSRDRVRRDFAVDDASLRAWYEGRYGRRGCELDCENLDLALRRAESLRRWGPIVLSASTALVVAILLSAAASQVPGITQVLDSPRRLLDMVSPEVLVETVVVLALVPVLVVEGILAALYTSDLDIGRLRRLRASLD
jgi:hypothetical protein